MEGCLVASTSDAPRLNPWVLAAFALLVALTLFVWLFDSGRPNGPYASTGWGVVYALAWVPAVGELAIAYIADRFLRGRAPKRAGRTTGPIRALATAAGVLGYVVLFLAALSTAVVIFFQSRGVLNPDTPLPLWELSVLFGLLMGTCILLGSQLPSVDRSVPEYKLYQDGSPPSKRDE
jgi:uncharacterized membrane protein